MAATTKRHPSRTRHRTGVTRDGKLIAMDIDFTIDGGAYETLSPVVLSRGTIHAAGPYNCPNVRVRSRAVATNTPPHGAFRGFGAPQSVFALERHMDRVAEAVGIAPDELRRRNFIHQGETLAVSQVVREKVDMEKLMDARLRAERLSREARPLPLRKCRQLRDQARHWIRRLSARRGIHRLRRGISGVGSRDGGDARGPRARPRRQHRDGPGHQHDFHADRRRSARHRPDESTTRSKSSSPIRRTCPIAAPRSHRAPR